MRKINEVIVLTLSFGVLSVFGKALESMELKPGQQYCPACLDKLFLAFGHHLDDRRYGRKIRVARSLQEHPCSEGSVILLSCPTSCLHLKMFYDESENKTIEMSYMDCAAGLVERLPGYDRGMFMLYHGNQTITQQVRVDFRFDVGFYHGFQTETAAINHYETVMHIKQFEAKWYHDTTNHIYIFVASLLFLIFVLYIVYRKSAERKQRSLGHNIEDEAVSRLEWEDHSHITAISGVEEGETGHNGTKNEEYGEIEEIDEAATVGN